MNGKPLALLTLVGQEEPLVLAGSSHAQLVHVEDGIERPGGVALGTEGVDCGKMEFDVVRLSPGDRWRAGKRGVGRFPEASGWLMVLCAR
jgi:hypothetical protein